MNTRLNSYILLIFTLFLFSAPLFHEAYAATGLKEIEENIMCMCKDNCGKVLVNCSCEFSNTMRKDISKMLRDNLTKDEILAFYIGKYGEKVLSAPTKKGFNLIAWVTPFLLVFLGGVVVWIVISSWVKTNTVEQEEQPSAGTEKNDKYHDKLKKELKDFDY